jgi:hypothetical protein
MTITITKRLLFTTVLAAALVFSQGGRVLVAALCPHLQSGMVKCETQPASAQATPEHMGEMGQGEHSAHSQMEPKPATEPDPDGIALSQPIDPCSHCAIHSSTGLTLASFKGVEGARRSLDLSVALHYSSVSPVSLAPVAVLSSRAHGPPGQAVPRHILINSFRI